MDRKRVAHYPQELGACVVCLLLSGCGTTFIGNRIDASHKSSETGLHYFLPEDVIEVVVTLEHTIVTGLDQDKNNKSIVTKQVKEETKAIAAVINLQTIPDTSQEYILDADAAGLATNNTALTITDTGLLQSVNAKTTGTAGVVFENVMKLAGEVLPLVSLGTGKAIFPPAAPLSNVSSILAHSATSFTMLQSAGATTGASSPKKAAPPCDINEVRQYFPDTKENVYGFNNFPAKSELIVDFCTTLELLRVRQKALEAAFAEYRKEKSQASLKALGGKLTTLRDEYTRMATLHTVSGVAIVNKIAEILQQENLGKKVNQLTTRAVLRFSELPKADQIRNLRSPKGPTISLPIGSSPQLAKLFDFTGIVVAADPIGAVVSMPSSDASSDFCNLKDKNKASDPMPCVYYRAPRSYLVSAWAITKVVDDTDKDKGGLYLSPSDSKIVDAIVGDAPVLAIELRDSQITKRDSALAFNARGRLTGLSRDYGSAAADASGAMVTGVQGGLSQYSTTLSNIKTIRDTQNQIELQPLNQQLAISQARSALDLQPIQAQITMAQQQLSLLNNQTALQSATQGQSAVLQTQIIGIQNALAAAQNQLLTTQNTLTASQANATQAKEQADVVARTNLLAAQITELQNALRMLDLQRQVNDLKKSQP